MDYQISHEDYTEENWKELVSLIENGELMDKKGFQFHDSKPVYFQHTDVEAVLKLFMSACLLRFVFKVCTT